MAGEKYLVATTENPLQITVRNILNPNGYIFLENCNDAITLLRMVRSYQPEFILVDIGIQKGDIRNTLETIDDEVLCAIILLGEYRDSDIFSMMEKSKVISFCPKPVNRELLLHTADMAVLNYKRVFELEIKLRQMTENYESRKQVDRAKGILMEKEGLSEKGAYERMRKRSMDERLSMRNIADLIIHSYGK